MVYLCGHLGAGKSTLARAWLRALGITGPIRSPTYTLVEPYSIPGGEALHLDLYRLGSSAEWDAHWAWRMPMRGCGWWNGPSAHRGVCRTRMCALTSRWREMGAMPY